MRNSDFENEIEPRVRPSFLTILCILTFIGSGMSIISSVFAYKTADKSGSIFSQIAKSDRDSATASSVTIKDSVYLQDSMAISDSVVNDQKRKSASEFDKKMKTSMAKVFTKENIQKRSIGDIIAAVFTLVGAILMWNLRREGFYLYVLGVLISLFIPLYIFGTDLMSIGLSIIGAFFGLVFIALYALNLKAMRRPNDEKIDFG